MDTKLSMERLPRAAFPVFSLAPTYEVQYSWQLCSTCFPLPEETDAEQSPSAEHYEPGRLNCILYFRAGPSLPPPRKRTMDPLTSPTDLTHPPHRIARRLTYDSHYGKAPRPILWEFPRSPRDLKSFSQVCSQLAKRRGSESLVHEPLPKRSRPSPESGIHSSHHFHCQVHCSSQSCSWISLTGRSLTYQCILTAI